MDNKKLLARVKELQISSTRICDYSISFYFIGKDGCRWEIEITDIDNDYDIRDHMDKAGEFLMNYEQGSMCEETGCFQRSRFECLEFWGAIGSKIRFNRYSKEQYQYINVHTLIHRDHA